MNPDITFRVYIFMNMALVSSKMAQNLQNMNSNNFVVRSKDELDLEDCDLIVLDVL